MDDLFPSDYRFPCYPGDPEVEPETGVPFGAPAPWERTKMTVCIVARCRDPEDNPVLVSCNDFKESSALGSSETALKIDILKPRWMVLSAGVSHHAYALKVEMRRALDGVDLNKGDLKGALSKALQFRKRQLAEDYVYSKFAVSYDDFLKVGKIQFPDDVFRAAMIDIQRLDLSCRLLIAGFRGRVPVIWRSTEAGIIELMGDYASIGEGQFLANASLTQRAQNEETPLQETLYNLYEAKRLTETVPSVGGKTAINIMRQNGETSGLHEAGYAHLRKRFKALSQKPVSKIALNNEMFYTWYDAPKK